MVHAILDSHSCTGLSLTQAYWLGMQKKILLSVSSGRRVYGIAKEEVAIA